jgi:hypothetical protein
LLRASAIEFLIGAAQLLFNFLLIADIANGTQHKVPITDGNRTQHDFHWKLRAIPAPTKKLQTCPHTSNFWSMAESAAVLVMAGTMTLWHQNFDFLAQEIVPRVPEKLFRL